MILTHSSSLLVLVYSIGEDLFMKYTLHELAQFLSAEYRGDPDCVITSIGSLANASSGQVSFLHDLSYSKYLSTTKATAVVLAAQNLGDQSGNFIIVKDPYLAYAKVSGLFNDAPVKEFGIHKTAIIGSSCEIGSEVSIGPYCIIGNRVKIGQGVIIEAGSIVSDEVTIGDGTRLCARVTLYHKVKLGKRVLLHSGAVIGSDGFGNANDRGVWYKIHQLGTVVIGDDVEIGANTSIDRGAIEDTVIEDGARLDNQVQVGHNVRIGAHTAIAGCVGIAGSAKIGRYCMIGGGVGINGHIEIADRVIIAGMSSVVKSITEPGGIYASAIPAVPHRLWWRILSRLMRIENLIERLKVLERKLI